MIVNGYLMIEDEDNEIYVSKSVDDVLDFYKSNYGTPEENLCGMSDSEFIEALHILDFTNLKYHIKNIDFNGVMKSKCDVYYEQAIKNEGCKPVLWFNI